MLKFRWVKPPSALGGALEQRYSRRLLLAVHAMAGYVGLQMQNAGRAAAPWEDRTGNARSGLFFAVDGFGLHPIVGRVSGKARRLQTDSATISGDKDRLILVFGHTVYYGKFLELAHGGRYAIVMSTLEARVPVLERMLKALLR
ncbi:MAG: hypothetical protein ACLFU8_06120 [Anaerolineales bacterium]